MNDEELRRSIQEAIGEFDRGEGKPFDAADVKRRGRELLAAREQERHDRERLHAALQVGIDQADRGELKELTVDDVKAAVRERFAPPH